MDATEKQEILDAIGAMREESRVRGEKTASRLDHIEAKLDQKSRDDEERFKRLEADTAAHRGAIVDLREQLNENTKLLQQQAQTTSNLAASTAHATSLALEAKQSASGSLDEARKVVESAIKIHGVSMTAAIDATVTKAVKPIADEVTSLKKNDESQNETLKKQDEKLAAIAKDASATKDVVVELANDARKVLRHPVLRRVLLVAAIVGATIGGAAAGYVGARAEHSVTKTP